MMTPQEVANCTFAKSMMGGYNMASVDDFLDKLTEDYAGLYKENAALKAKLKVTVDKMAEYREEQDAIRTTLLTAQKMASAMMTEAELGLRKQAVDPPGIGMCYHLLGLFRTVTHEPELPTGVEKIGKRIFVKYHRAGFGKRVESEIIGSGKNFHSPGVYHRHEHLVARPVHRSEHGFYRYYLQSVDSDQGHTETERKTLG